MSYNKAIAKTKEYKTWKSLKERCLNPNSIWFKRYGRKGITICDEWKNDFEKFLEDMGLAPDGMKLYRKDNQKGYYKENCFWSFSRY